MAFVATCFITMLCAFSFSPVDEECEDYTYLHLFQQPVTDVSLPAYSCVSRAPLDIQICPGTGYRCSARLTVFGAEVVVNEQKGRGRANVEISAN